MPDNHRSVEKQETRPQGQRRPKAPPEVDKIQGEAQAAGGEFSQSSFETHAAMLGASGMSHPMNARQQAMIAQRLQRDYGNHYVQRLVDYVQPKMAETAQPKLTVGAAGDRYEREADRVAKQVMGNLPAANGDPAQREVLEDEQLQMLPRARTAIGDEVDPIHMKPAAQRQVPLEGGHVDSDAEHTIHKLRGKGQGLPDTLRSSMEAAFGADFSEVRLHTGPEVDTLNDSMSARAFTTGQDIFLRQGEYNPGSSGGQELLAHELTHVLQQSGGDIQTIRRVMQPLDSPTDIDALLKHAEAANGDLEGITKEIASIYRGRGGMGPLKREVRIRAKAEEKYGGDVREVLDVVRSTVTFRSLYQMFRARDYALNLKHAHYADDSPTKVKDKYEKVATDETGYRDIKIIMELNNGHFGELQLQHQFMKEAKALAHPLYKMIRITEGTLELDPRKLDPLPDAMDEAYAGYKKELKVHKKFIRKLIKDLDSGEIIDITPNMESMMEEISAKLYGMAAKKAMSNEFKNVNQMHSGKMTKSKAKISSKGPKGKV